MSERTGIGWNVVDEKWKTVKERRDSFPDCVVRDIQKETSFRLEAGPDDKGHQAQFDVMLSKDDIENLVNQYVEDWMVKCSNCGYYNLKSREKCYMCFDELKDAKKG